MAKTKFDKLSGSVAKEYEKKGMTPAHAKAIGAAVAARIGREKMGAAAFNAKAAKGRSK